MVKKHTEEFVVSSSRDADKHSLYMNMNRRFLSEDKIFDVGWNGAVATEKVCHVVWGEHELCYIFTLIELLRLTLQDR